MEVTMGTPIQSPASGGEKQLAHSSDTWDEIGVLASLAFVFVLAIGISQRPIMSGDGYHLLAGQMVAAGRLPYVDFFFQQAPLYALVCGAWMRIVGSSWQAANLLSALFVGGSAMIIARIARQIYSESGWGVKGSIVALLLFGLNIQLAQMGDIAQPYSLCMFFCLLAWPPAFNARPRAARFFASGLAAGAAVNTTLLAFPFLLVLTGYSALQTARLDRYRGLLWLLCGAAVASIPLAYLTFLAPSQMWFAMLEFHLFHRADGYEWTNIDIMRHNMREILMWTTSTQGVLLVFLSLTGLPFLFDLKIHISTRSSLRYAALVAFSWGLFLSLPRPTFFIYYVLVIPYVCLLASAGLWGMAARMWSTRWATIVLIGATLLYSLEVTRPFISNSLSLKPGVWADREDVARKIDTITGPTDPVYADDASVYVAARRLPPRGLETSAASVLLPPEDYARAGLVPYERNEAQLRAGGFAAVVLLKTPHNTQKIQEVSQLYSRSTETMSYVLFWKSKLQPAEGL
jgi:hypothetical protein